MEQQRIKKDLAFYLFPITLSTRSVIFFRRLGVRFIKSNPLRSVLTGCCHVDPLGISISDMIFLTKVFMTEEAVFDTIFGLPLSVVLP